ncbi:hypothetical protein JW935_27505 [candidate division KSB1 bacterium]|nr:hypothetical protein [candidate division KSB1 bacterium]
MEQKFGEKVKQAASELASQGRDANQIAKILFDQDDKGYNYGIGIILDGQGQPMKSSSILLTSLEAELKNSQNGSYMNSAKLMADLKKAVLTWQRIPGQYWDRFILALPSDAGTGAVKTAVELELSVDTKQNTLGFEKLGWPAYKAIAKMARVTWAEKEQDELFKDQNVLPIYQAGPMNTTGMVRGAGVVAARAESAVKNNKRVVLDRAYSGFEFAGRLETTSYDDVMRSSYELQIKPFLEMGAGFSMAVSPTKAFVTFALRPCGFLLVYCPDDAQIKEMTTAVNTAIRARGSSFEHPVTRAFVKAMANNLSELEKEHQNALLRLAEAAKMWRKLTENTPMASLFSDKYAGLFRNPLAKEGAAVSIYNEHLYPVLTGGRCRLNATGIPRDPDLAAKHVAVFAQYCYEG